MEAERCTPQNETMSRIRGLLPYDEACDSLGPPQPPPAARVALLAREPGALLEIAASAGEGLGGAGGGAHAPLSRPPAVF